MSTIFKASKSKVAFYRVFGSHEFVFLSQQGFLLLNARRECFLFSVMRLSCYYVLLYPHSGYRPWDFGLQAELIEGLPFWPKKVTKVLPIPAGDLGE